MAVFKCKMCGGALEIGEGQSVATCDYCGTQQTLPRFDDERKLALFNRANNLRFKNEFDKAAGIYESIITEFFDEAEAYWGLVLCKYGIEYVDDKSGRKVPTCHRTLPVSVMSDTDFQQACEYADIGAKNIYREEAKAIDAIQKKILEIATTEEPYDIFICYKETDDVTGARTEDSSIAQDIYTAFTEMGYKVFYAHNSLRKIAGTEYEPYIYAALSSAKIMLAIGTKFEYYDAVWVKNEWSRFISMMVDDSSKVLIPCYKNMDAYDMPGEFSNMQALDISDMMFFNSLETSVNRILQAELRTNVREKSTTTNEPAITVESLLKRVFVFLADGQWQSADEYCEKVLDIEPENAQAYLGKLMVELRVNNKDGLKNLDRPFDDRNNYQRVMTYGDSSLKSELSSYVEYIKSQKENIRCERIYKLATSALSMARTDVEFEKIASDLTYVGDYKDAKEIIEDCLKKAKKIKLEKALAEEEKDRAYRRNIRLVKCFLVVVCALFISTDVLFSFGMGSQSSFVSSIFVSLFISGFFFAFISAPAVLCAVKCIKNQKVGIFKTLCYIFGSLGIMIGLLFCVVCLHTSIDDPIVTIEDCFSAAAFAMIVITNIITMIFARGKK